MAKKAKRKNRPKTMEALSRTAAELDFTKATDTAKPFQSEEQVAFAMREATGLSDEEIRELSGDALGRAIMERSPEAFKEANERLTGVVLRSLSEAGMSPREVFDMKEERVDMRMDKVEKMFNIIQDYKDGKDVDLNRVWEEGIFFDREKDKFKGDEFRNDPAPSKPEDVADLNPTAMG